MEWPIDQKTQTAARDFPLRIKAQQARPQYGGGAFNPDKWRHRVRREDDFLPVSQGRFPNCPQQIIEEFQAVHYLPALALVVSWGQWGGLPDGRSTGIINFSTSTTLYTSAPR
jgi:hypothetical protein